MGETMMLRKAKFEEAVKENDVDSLCEAMVEMALVHIDNNLFLVQLRRFVELLQRHCAKKLEFLMVKCGMVQRFIAFYEQSTRPSALRSFILAILWEMKGGKCIVGNDAKRFMSTVVEKEIALQETKEPPKV